MHGAGLAPNLPERVRVRDGFGTRIHVAPTARRELHSGLVSSLKEPECGDPEWHDQRNSPRPRDLDRKQDDGKQGTGAQGDEAESETVPLAAGADVGDAQWSRV